MDYVYVCRDGENEELRYSLRSLEKNMPSGNVWIIGGKPDWYCGNFIAVEQTRKTYANVREQLRVACKNKNISDDFILMNDDFYAINSVTKIPTWYTGTIVNRIRKLQQIKSQNSGYVRMLIVTNNVIRRMGIVDPLDYELHIPMQMNKEKLLPILESTALWRSAYGNTYEIGGSQHNDVKIHSTDVLEDREKNLIDIHSEPFISASDYNFEFLKNVILEEMFPEPSSFESP